MVGIPPAIKGGAKEFFMTAEDMIKLIEEMIDLKIRQHASTTIPATKTTPGLAKMVVEMHAADHRRLQQVKTELLKMLAG